MEEPPGNALDAQQFAGHGEAFLVADGIGMAHAGEVGDGRYEVLADALHRPGTRRTQGAGAGVLGHDRALGIGEHHLQLRLDLLEEPGKAGQGTGGADADDDGVEIVAGLRPELRAGAALVGQRVGRVVELVGEEGAGNILRQARGNVLVVLRMALADVRAGDVHLGAHGAQVQDLLGGHLVRHHQHHPVALGAADQGQAKTGVAGGGLDDGATGPQAAVTLGGLDHGDTDAILDGAAGVLRFELEVQGAGAGIEARHANQRGVADQVEHGGT